MDKDLLEGLTVRPATLEDVETIYGLVRTYDLAQYGEEDSTLDDVRTWHSAPGVNLAEDTRVVFDQTGRLISWLMLEHRLNAKCFITIRVLPDSNDPRVSDYLMHLSEGWARERMIQAEPGVRVSLNAWVPSTDQDSLNRCERAGFREIRRHWRMEIELNEMPAAPEWPQGVELRPFMSGYDDRRVFEAINTAFQDHWGYMPEPYDEWRHYTVERAGFDPSLWFIAYEGDQIAGISLCAIYGQFGAVDTLGVLRPWRRKGLGLALLQHSFGEFYRRGLRKAYLGVDSQSLTGATRLYARAGMHVAREYISFEKELRAGVELSTQALSV